MDQAGAAYSDTRVRRDVAAQLRALVQLAEPPIVRIASLLDELDNHTRVAAVRTLGRAEQRALWTAADGFAPLALTDMVAADAPPGSEVRHFGKNTLLMYTEFEKRFCRLPQAESIVDAELCGYNFQESSVAMAMCGPGYFMATEDRVRGEVVIDYRRMPAERPNGWPVVRPNEGGLAGMVYGNMVDTLRRVSQHVTIGRANKGGRDIAAWFVLCRQA